MDLVSYLEWLYRQDLMKIHHGQLPFLGLWLRDTRILFEAMRVQLKSLNRNSLSLQMTSIHFRDQMQLLLHPIAIE